MTLYGDFSPGHQYKGLLLIDEMMDNGAQPAPFISVSIGYTSSLLIFTSVSVSEVAYNYMSDWKKAMRRKYSGALSPKGGLRSLRIAANSTDRFDLTNKRKPV